MTERPPLVTVGVPVYNGERFLVDALTHLQQQTSPDIEIVISDNGSTDRTPDICHDFAGRDRRIRHVRSDVNHGLVWNYNRVLELARGEYFTWNSSDDVALPGHLSRCVEALRAHPNAVLALAGIQLIDADGAVVGEIDNLDLDLEGPDPTLRAAEYCRRQAFYCVGYGGVINTAVLRAHGGLPEFYGGDLALGLRLALAGPFAIVPERLYRARRHEAQSSRFQTASINEQVRHFTGTNARLVHLPQWRMNAEMLKCAVGSPIPIGARFRCVGAVLTGWTFPHWRLLAFDVKRAVRHLLQARRS